MEGVEAFGRQAVLDDILPAIDKYFQKKEQDSGKAGKSPLWKLMNSLHIPVLDAFLTFVDVEKGVLEGVKSSKVENIAERYVADDVVTFICDWKIGKGKDATYSADGKAKAVQTYIQQRRKTHKESRFVGAPEREVAVHAKRNNAT